MPPGVQLLVDLVGHIRRRHVVDAGHAAREIEIAKRRGQPLPELFDGRAGQRRLDARIAQDRGLAVRRALDPPHAGGIGSAAPQPGHLVGHVVDQQVVRTPPQDDRVLGQLAIELLAGRHHLVVGALPDDPGAGWQLGGPRLQSRDDFICILERRRLNRHVQLFRDRQALDVRMRVDEPWEERAAVEIDDACARPDKAADVLLAADRNDPVTRDGHRRGHAFLRIDGDHGAAAQDEVGDGAIALLPCEAAAIGTKREREATGDNDRQLVDDTRVTMHRASLPQLKGVSRCPEGPTSWRTSRPETPPRRFPLRRSLLRLFYADRRYQRMNAMYAKDAHGGVTGDPLFGAHPERPSGRGLQPRARQLTPSAVGGLCLPSARALEGFFRSP